MKEIRSLTELYEYLQSEWGTQPKVCTYVPNDEAEIDIIATPKNRYGLYRVTIQVRKQNLFIVYSSDFDSYSELAEFIATVADFTSTMKLYIIAYGDPSDPKDYPVVSIRPDEDHVKIMTIRGAKEESITLPWAYFPILQAMLYMIKIKVEDGLDEAITYEKRD